MKSMGLVLAATLLAAVAAQAAETPGFTIVIQDHRFDPAELKVPAGKKLKLVIDNRDPTPEEFESRDLKREKIVAGNSKATVWIGPLKSGTYRFFGEYHEDTAKGKLVVE